jgi:signal transduction histidine kinase
MRFHSIRWQLSLTYAGIALLTALFLNLLLRVSLLAYYDRQELAYLRDNAAFITQNLIHLIDEGVPNDALAAQLKVLSFLTQTRLRLLDEREAVVADSGPPALAQVEIVVAPQGPTSEESPPDQAVGATGQEDGSVYEAYLRFLPLRPALLGSLEPLEPMPPLSQAREPRVIVLPGGTEGLEGRPVLARSSLPALDPRYGLGWATGGRSDARSGAQQTFPLVSAAGGAARQKGFVEMSEGPAFGGEVLVTVARLGSLAGLVAVLVAAGAGWLVSRRLSRPVMALAEAATRMSEGDLGARAGVRQSDELGLLGEAFNHMAERLEGLVGSLRRFIADGAHELNTPLAILHTDLDLLVASEPEPRQRQLADRLLLQVQRLEALVAGMLDLSRLEATPAAEPGAPLDLTALTREAAEKYASQAEQAGLAFELDLQDGEPVEILADREQMTRVIGNLLDNAIKFTPTGGRVRLAINRTDRWAELQVEDTGIGIPPEDLPELFGRFHRGRNSAAYPGSGLGLAIVQQIVERHGGRVEAESGGTRGAGARFRVWLPLLHT